MCTLPALARKTPANRLSSVDLPAPDGPSSPTISPGATSRSTPDRAATSCPSVR